MESELVFTDEDLKHMRTCTENNTKGLIAQKIVLDKFIQFFPNLMETSYCSNSMDLYDPIKKIRIEVKSLLSACVNNIDSKFILDMKICPDDNAYIFINLEKSNMKTKILGNVFIINYLDLSNNLLNIILNSINHMCKYPDGNRIQEFFKKYESSIALKSKSSFTMFLDHALQKIEELTSFCPQCGYKHGTKIDENFYDKNKYIKIEIYNELVTKYNLLEKDNNILKNEIVNLKNTKISKPSSIVELRSVESINEILKKVVEENIDKLKDGIARKEFYEIIDTYCDNNHINRIYKTFIQNYMKDINTWTSTRLKNTSLHMFKISNLEYNLTPNMRFQNEIENLNISDNDTIYFEYSKSKSEATGENLTLKEIILLNKKYFEEKGKIPNQTTGVINYNNKLINLSRQLSLIKSRYPNAYEKINEYAYNFNLTIIDTNNACDTICNKISYAVKNKIKFMNIIFSFELNKPTNLFSTLQKISQNTVKSSWKNNIIDNINKIIDTYDIYIDEIKQYRLDENNNKTCSTFYKLYKNEIIFQ